jgi:hypothetical protein
MEALAFLLFAAACLVSLRVFDERKARIQLARKHKPHARPLTGEAWERWYVEKSGDRW